MASLLTKVSICQIKKIIRPHLGLFWKLSEINKMKRQAQNKPSLSVNDDEN